MGHHHGHGGHHHHHSTNTKVLRQSFLLIAGFMIVEVIGGFLTNSLALLSDAGHMLSDAAALGLAYAAARLGEKKATNKNSFGYKRFEIIAASLNGLTLLLIGAVVIYEAVKRFITPPEVQSTGMFIVAVIGLLVNVAAAWLLMHGDREENLNIKSAFLHVIGDMLGSIGAIAAAVLIYFFGWGAADPAASIIASVLILVSGFRVIKESFHILMEGTPQDVDTKSLKNALMDLPDVINVHDLHVWSITSGFPSLSCHLCIKNYSEHAQVLKEAQNLLHDKFGIEHSTIQIELLKNGCPSPHGTCN